MTVDKEIDLLWRWMFGLVACVIIIQLPECTCIRREILKKDLAAINEETNG